MEKTELCKLFEEYGADKCLIYRHSYSTEYNKLLYEYRESYHNVLEIGVGTAPLMQRYLNKTGKKYVPGASLRAWRDYFVNANIYGIDIEKDVLFTDDRIQCFYTDQSNKEQLHATINEIKKINGEISFDMILDDGSHDLNHMILSMCALEQYLTPNGYYIIEDVRSQQIQPIIQSIPNTLEHVLTYTGKDYWDNFIVLRKI